MSPGGVSSTFWLVFLMIIWAYYSRILSSSFLHHFDVGVFVFVFLSLHNLPVYFVLILKCCSNAVWDHCDIIAENMWLNQSDADTCGERISRKISRLIEFATVSRGAYKRPTPGRALDPSPRTGNRIYAP